MVFNFNFFKNRQFIQSVLLLGTSVLVMLFILIINYLATRILTKSEFGDYSLILNIFNFAVIIFNFGFFHSISRMIAISKNSEEKKQLFGVGLVIVIFLFIIMGIFLLFYSVTFDMQSNLSNIRTILLIILPFSWVFLLNNYNELILQGSNNIGLLCLSRTVPKLLLALLLTLMYFFYNAIVSVLEILILFIICNILPYIYIVIKLKPSFKNFKEKLNEVKTSNRLFGFNIYIGSLLAVGASSLTGILIGYFGINNTDVGYYSIALQLATPLSLIPNVIATVSFKMFANADSIDKKLLIIMYLTSLLALIFIFIFGESIVTVIYGSEYLRVVYLLHLLTISSLLYGIADFYNKFLLAKGQGKELRNASFFVGIILLVSNLILIRFLGAYGATIASIIAGFCYLLIILYYFKNIQHKASN